MESLRQIGIGILLAIISITVILGGFTLATAEGNLSAKIPVATETFEPALAPTSVPSEIPPANSQPTLPLPTLPALTETPLATNTSVATHTPLATKTALATNTYMPTRVPSATAIMVPTSTPLPAMTKIPTSTTRPVVTSPVYYTAVATYAACGAPYGWINYYVVSGDTLYGIGTRYGVSVSELQLANCMAGSVTIQIGKLLKVPNVATIPPLIVPTSVTIPTAMPVATEIPSATAQATVTSPPPTDVPVELPTGTPYGGLGGG